MDRTMWDWALGAGQSLFVATVLGFFGAIIRWGLHLDRIINQTMKASELLAERLNGHEKIDDARFESVTRELEQLHTRVTRDTLTS